MEDLEFTQEEANTKIILHYFSQAGCASKGSLVRSPDTDVYLLLLHYSFSIAIKVCFDTGVRNHRRIIAITDLSYSNGSQYRDALLGHHSFSRCDPMSSFVRKGTVTALKILYQYPDSHASRLLSMHLEYQNCRQTRRLLWNTVCVACTIDPKSGRWPGPGGSLWGKIQHTKGIILEQLQWHGPESPAPLPIISADAHGICQLTAPPSPPKQS